ncbi:MAG TPA: hypothetical protein VHM69_09335 [Rubrobacter sp.]|nr:hypothetical protein [Rubrobacter sp.]
MNRRQTNNLVRLGILALPLSGLLTLWGLLGRYTAPNPRVDFEAAAKVASSTSFIVSQFVGNIGGLALLILGIFALTAYLANSRARSLAVAAMILSILSLALVLPALGVTTYTLPVLGHAYLNGQEDAKAIGDALFGNPLRNAIYIPVFALYATGFILFGVAIWRSGILRKGAALALGIHAPLVSSFIKPQPNLLVVLGALLFIMGGVFITLDVFRGPPTSRRREGPE